MENHPRLGAAAMQRMILGLGVLAAEASSGSFMWDRFVKGFWQEVAVGLCKSNGRNTKLLRLPLVGIAWMCLAGRRLTCAARVIFFVRFLFCCCFCVLRQLPALALGSFCVLRGVSCPLVSL